MAVESNTKFPYPLNDNPFVSLGMITKDFISGLKKCIISVDKNSIKREYAGVTFIAKKDKEIVLYASKHNTVITKYITDMKSTVDCTMILPYFFCELLVRNFEEDVTELMYNDKIVKMSVNSDDKIFYTLYDSHLKILDFENEIANLKIASIKTFDVSDDIKNILKRCLIILDTEKDKKIKVSLSTDKMSINAISSLCNFDENVELKGNVNNIDFTLNAGFMKETLDEADKFGIADEAFIGTNDKYTTLVAINY